MIKLIKMFKFLNNSGEVLNEDIPIEARQAYEEIAAEEEGRTPEDLLSKPKEEDDDDSQTEDQKKKDEELEEDDSEEEEDDSGSEEEEEEEEEAEDEDEEESDEDNPDESEDEADDEDKRIQEYAEKYSMTYAEAKEDLDKIDEIIKQYKDDPAEMAKAIRHKDREYHKLKNTVNDSKNKPEPLFKRMSDDEFRAYARKAILADEKYIEAYKKQFPSKTEIMTDEAIAEEAAELELEVYKREADKKEREIRQSADDKRIQLLSDVAENHRRLLPDIKVFLQNTSDETLLDKDFDIEDAILWAKGKRYDKDIEQARSEASKRKGSKIIGIKSSSKGKSKPVVKKKSAGTTLTAEQKEVAEQMFGFNFEPEECYKMFKDTFADELKEDPKFVR